MAPDSGALDPLQAYETVMQFAARRGPSALRLALHASMPQVLRPALLHQLRINFVPESLDDLAVEADVLFAPFCDDLGNDYYQFDPAARRLLLQELDPTYRHLHGARSHRLARFLSVYIDHELRVAAIDALYRDYLEVEAWVALAFLDPDAAAEQLARAIETQLTPGSIAARVRIGDVADALTIPLARHRSVVTYAEAVDALDSGDVDRGTALMQAVGEEGLRVGAVTLPPPSETLKVRQVFVQAPSPAQRAEEPASAEGRRPATAAPQVFLSYELQRFEQQCAGELAYYLERLGLRVWRRETHPFEAGVVVEDAIRQAIRDSRAAVVLAERVYMDDDVALWELQEIRGAAIGERGLRGFWIATSGQVPNSEELRSLDRLIESEQPLRDVPAARRAEMVRDAAMRIASAVGLGVDVVPELRLWPRDESPQPAAGTTGTVLISCANADLVVAERLVKSFVDHDEIGFAEVLPVVDPRGRGLQRLQQAGAFIQLVSRNWPSGPLGRQPFDRTNQIVENVKAAFERRVPVVPVLIDGAAMPRMDAFPERIRKLGRLQAASLREDRWDNDVAALVTTLTRLRESPVVEDSPRPSPRVFVGFAAADRALAATVSEALRARDISRWRFDENIRPGDDFGEVIAGAIRQCDVLVLIVTTAAMRSDWVLRELELAIQFNKGIVPVVVGDVMLTDRMDDLLSGIVRIQMSPTPGAGVLDRIAGSIRNVAELPASSTAAQRSSRERSSRPRWTPRVYVSYASADGAEVVAVLKKELQALGVDVFIDQSDLAAGRDLVGTIERAIDECEAMVLIASHASAQSEWVRREVALAITRKKKILPIVLDDVDVGSIHPLLTRIQHLRSNRPPDAEVAQRIADAVFAAPLRFDTSDEEKPSASRRSVTVHTLLFVGHTVDRPGRTTPRFPPRFVGVAEDAIRNAVRQQRDRSEHEVQAIASGSDGGDILFHEVCVELGIPSTMHLPMPAVEFKRAFLTEAGDEWIDRFDRLQTVVAVIVNRSARAYDVPQSVEAAAPSYRRDPWYANTRAMLDASLLQGPERATLIALWNNEWGGPGGPSDLIERANERGVELVVLDTRRLFRLDPGTPPTNFAA